MKIENIDHLELRLYSTSETVRPLFEVIVNGKPYLETIAAFEQRFKGGPVGAYMAGLGEETLRHRLLEKDAHITPYICDCGEPGCWPLVCQTKVMDSVVIWTNWSNPHRDDKSREDEGYYWDYSSLPDLIFERQAYEKAINNALAELSS